MCSNLRFRQDNACKTPFRARIRTRSCKWARLLWATCLTCRKPRRCSNSSDLRRRRGNRFRIWGRTRTQSTLSWVKIRCCPRGSQRRMSSSGNSLWEKVFWRWAKVTRQPSTSNTLARYSRTSEQRTFWAPFQRKIAWIRIRLPPARTSR